MTGAGFSGMPSALARDYGISSRIEAGVLDRANALQAGHRYTCTGRQELWEACHDMRQTVAALQALADAALADCDLQGTTRAHVERIASQAEILADTIRLQLHPAGDDQRRPRLLDLNRLTFDLADGERVTYKGVLEVIGEPAPVLIHARRDDVRRVLCNLLSNATRAAGPAGRVVVEVRVEAGLAEVIIENTGPTLAAGPEGTGLGWSIITQRLLRTGGRLAYGQGKRGGVRATLWLPLAVY